MENDAFSLSDKEFDLVKGRLLEVAGISLSDAKRTLVISRLSKVIKKLSLDGFSSYLDFLDSSKAKEADKQDFVNALTTNLTRFYREDHHFDHLQKYIAQVIAQKPRTSANGKPRLRIWSAGCSTGQEPYTIAMSLLTKFPELKRWDFKILASDIDTNVVNKAAKGIYPENELAGLSEQRAKIFERPGDGTIRIPKAMRNIITFKPLNLFDPWPIKGPFDAIFCRNVAIYFDKPVQDKLFSQLGDVLAHDGHMYIGHSENVGRNSTKFSLVGKTVYRSIVSEAQRDVA
jgi:chemotaxis protein methyltransferase CheR